MDRIVQTMCAANCGGRSLLDCTVRDGTLVKVEAAPHPDERYRGLCVRCLTLPQWVYAQDRISSPMRRVTPRSSGEPARFEPISWDAAFDEIATRFAELRDRHGGESIAFTRTSGASPNGNYMRLADLLGATNFFGGVDMAVHMGLNQALGYKGMFGQHANEWTDRVNSKVIIVWGNNAAETSMTSFKFLLDAREAGAELVVIDPRYSATAMHATWWLAPHPGTDMALALGMLRVIIEEGLVDRDFARRHSCAPFLVRADGRFARTGTSPTVWDGSRGRVVPAEEADDPILDPGTADGRTVYQLLRASVAPYTPEKVESLTGIPAADVRDLAVLYATGGAALIGFGYGVDRYVYGDMLTRAAAALAVLTGNLGKPGAGVGVQSHGQGWREVSLSMGGLASPREATARAVPMAVVGHRPLEVRALFVQGDWLNQRVADMNRVKAFVDDLDFVVVVDHFHQTMCDLADIVLPASTFVEGIEWVRDAVIAANCVVLRQRVIAPVGDSLPDAEIERRLGERLGFGEHYRESAEQMVRRQIEESSDPLLAGITLDGLRAAGGAVRLTVPFEPNVQYANLAFPTPSGRVEFYAERLAGIGQALPIYLPDHEANAAHPSAVRHPLVLTQAHVRQRAHSTFFNTAWTLSIWPEPICELNPDDAEERSVATGDLVEVRNDRGRLVVRAVRNPDYPPGQCNVSEGWKQHQYIEGNVQALTNPFINEAQELAWGHANIPFYDTRVEVVRVGGS